MIRRSWRKALVFAAFGILLATTAWVVDHLQKQARPDEEVVLWSDLRNRPDSEIGILQSDLKLADLDEVVFKETPFSECLAQLQRMIVDEHPHIAPITFQIEEEVSPTSPITLHLREVPALEALQYLGGLNSARYDLELGRTVVFDVGYLDRERFREEGWFRIPPGFFEGIDPSAETANVRDQLQRLGIALESGEVSIYYPKRGLLWASADVDNMEEIDFLASSIFYDPEPPWNDRLMEWRYRQTSRLRPAAPAAPVPPGPASGQGLPDPFGVP